MLPHLLLLALLATHASAAAYPNSRDPTSTMPLFEYMNLDRGVYKVNDTGLTLSGDGWTGYYLNLTSQQWMTPAQVSISVWTHQLVVIVPDNLEFTNMSAIYATGGSNSHWGNPAPKATSEDILVSAILAVGTKSIVSTLFQIPNAPVVFADDPEQKQRSEDHFVAWTWVEYVKYHRDTPEWVNLLPMVKSVVRAMDAVQEWTKQKGIADIQSFNIAGASKRGWTTWLTGAVDKRVVGIAPIVMDLLNFDSVVHMTAAYGGWSFAFQPYWELNVTSWFGNDALIGPLKQIIDPLNYAKYLEIPKLVIDATGDEFFMLDNDHYWWGDLPGESYRLHITNAEHSEATGLGTLLPGAQAFLLSQLTNSQRPRMSWTMDASEGSITLVTEGQPHKVVLRFASTWGEWGKGHRDFRLIKGDTKEDPCNFIPVKIFGTACLNPVIWVGETIAPTSNNGTHYVYHATQPLPEVGWRAFLLDTYWDGPVADSTYRLTTQVNIIPNTFPFKPCNATAAGCQGVLV